MVWNTMKSAWIAFLGLLFSSFLPFYRLATPSERERERYWDKFVHHNHLKSSVVHGGGMQHGNILYIHFATTITTNRYYNTSSFDAHLRYVVTAARKSLVDWRKACRNWAAVIMIRAHSTHVPLLFHSSERARAYTMAVDVVTQATLRRCHRWMRESRSPLWGLREWLNCSWLIVIKWHMTSVYNAHFRLTFRVD